MTKPEFLSQLKAELAGFTESEIEHYIEYYSEMIDDKIEDGMTEKKALASIGTPKEVIAKILEETPLPKLIKNKLKPNRKLITTELVLIIAGSPVWVSLLAAALAVVIALIASVAATLISLWAANLVFAVSAVAGVVCPIFFIIQGNVASAFAALGMGLFLAGVSVYMFFGLKALTLFTVKSCKRFMLNLKLSLMKKEEAK